MNDLLLLGLLAAIVHTYKGGNLCDSVDRAEEILDEIVTREFNHTMKHIGNQKPETCYYCRITAMGLERYRKEQTLKTGIIQ